MLIKVDESESQKLVERLYENEAFLGGKDLCYQKEKKTRIFIDEVLKFVC